MTSELIPKAVKTDKRRPVTGGNKARAEQLSRNLKKLMCDCDIDGLQLARNVGVTPTTIYRLLNDSSCNPTLSSLEAIADFFSITLNQLLGDEGIAENNKGKFKPTISKWNEIPLLQWDEVLKWQNNKLLISPDHNHIYVDLDLTQKAFSTKMKGDSMEPRFPEGTILIFEPARIPENRDFVLLQLENQKLPVLKQIFLDGEEIYLKSLNQDFHDIKKYKLNSGYKILGVMVQARTNFTR